MVRSMEFLFAVPSAPDQQVFIAVTSADTESNISAFVERIKHMTPMLKKISILPFPDDNGPHFPVHQLNSLFAQLYQHAVDIAYNIGHQPVILDQKLCGLRSLVYSSSNLQDRGKQIMELARRNVSTLQLLDINVDAIINITDLIQNADGSYAQYPCLQSFKLRGPQDIDVPQQPVFPGAVPFPRLRCLDIGMVNPFGDDTPFRGNVATLESLSLSPSPGTTRVLREYRIFTPVSHPRLQYVHVGVDLYYEPRIFTSYVDYVRFVLNIGANASVRVLFGFLEGSTLHSVLPALGEYTCIQVLKLGPFHVNLWDAIALVKALPLLSDLYAPSPVLGPLPDGIAKNELPAYVTANYLPRGKWFRCWVFTIPPRDIENAVRCVLLLALVCANFDYAAVSKVKRELFMAHMREMISTDGFRPQAPRLRRLLFGGWKNEIRSVNTVFAESGLAQFELARRWLAEHGHTSFATVTCLAVAVLAQTNPMPASDTTTSPAPKVADTPVVNVATGQMPQIPQVTQMPSSLTAISGSPGLSGDVWYLPVCTVDSITAAGASATPPAPESCQYGIQLAPVPQNAMRMMLRVMRTMFRAINAAAMEPTRFWFGRSSTSMTFMPEMPEQ
ncbi:hypothetical protein GGI19_004841 [Coemansia pectinata]|uniref:Uncharacterized protein n=1 Tax=Coemansia pectinata TaxID=1052879 RepID=A0A9W8GVG1_9FUNG|nr:hypothetical protein GGI19_004841 [Coemansia pectinata]